VPLIVELQLLLLLLLPAAWAALLAARGRQLLLLLGGPLLLLGLLGLLRLLLRLHLLGVRRRADELCRASSRRSGSAAACDGRQAEHAERMAHVRWAGGPPS
jgi:hypothetical protein